MSEYNYIKSCPICDHSTFNPFINCVDYTVSNKEFSIVICDNCDFHFTNPIPKISEIGAYYKSETYVSHSSTKKGLINKIYHLVRSYTLKKKVALVNKVKNGNNILDIGAGTGHFFNALKHANLNPIGLEPDEDARAVALKEHGGELQPLENLYKLEDASIDVVTMWHVLEHVYDLRKDLQQISNLLKEDGTLIVAVPNRTSFDAKHYKEFWAAYDLPIHLYHFSPLDIKNLMEHYNLEVESVLPMKFDSYYVSMLSEKYKGGNILKAVLNGFRSNLKAKEGTYSSQIYVMKKKK